MTTPIRSSWTIDELGNVEQQAKRRRIGAAQVFRCARCGLVATGTIHHGWICSRCASEAA